MWAMKPFFSFFFFPGENAELPVVSEWEASLRHYPGDTLERTVAFLGITSYLERR